MTYVIQETTPPPRPTIPESFALKVPPLLCPHPIIVLGRVTGQLVNLRVRVSTRFLFEKIDHHKTRSMSNLNHRCPRMRFLLETNIGMKSMELFCMCLTF